MCRIDIDLMLAFAAFFDKNGAPPRPSAIMQKIADSLNPLILKERHASIHK